MFIAASRLQVGRSLWRRGWEGTRGSVSRKAESQLSAGDRSSFEEHHLLILLWSQNPKPQLGSMETRRLTCFLSNRILASSELMRSGPWRAGQEPVGEFTWYSKGAPHIPLCAPHLPPEKTSGRRKYMKTKFHGERKSSLLSENSQRLPWNLSFKSVQGWQFSLLLLLRFQFLFGVKFLALPRTWFWLQAERAWNSLEPTVRKKINPWIMLLLIKEARICTWSSAPKKPRPFQKGVEGVHWKHAEPVGATSRDAPLPGTELSAPPTSPSLTPRKARREVLPGTRPPSGLYKEKLQVD